MRLRWIIIALLVLIACAVGVWLAGRSLRAPAAPEALVLYGNVDLRQVDLAFNNSERIDQVLVREGDRVRRGQILATLDTRRLVPQVDQAAARVSAQEAAVDRLHHGSRPEEVAQARANVDSAKADAQNARLQFNRLKALQSSRAVSQQDIDNAQAALNVSLARLEVNQKALDLAVAGPRKEDVAQAEAQLRAEQAQLALLKQQLADAKLASPLDAVVRSRLLEPGDMASPLKPVLSLAIMDPKWVRAYVSEPDLGKVHPGMPAEITVDSFPGRRFSGWIGFISPVAEFTPRQVETKELRTQLVYEVRIFVKDPGDVLRLGMPATAELSLGARGAATSPATQAATQVSEDTASRP